LQAAAENIGDGSPGSNNLQVFVTDIACVVTDPDPFVTDLNTFVTDTGWLVTDIKTGVTAK